MRGRRNRMRTSLDMQIAWSYQESVGLNAVEQLTFIHVACTAAVQQWLTMNSKRTSALGTYFIVFLKPKQKMMQKKCAENIIEPVTEMIPKTEKIDKCYDHAWFPAGLSKGGRTV